MNKVTAASELPRNVTCCVMFLDPFSSDYEETLKNHFKNRICVTCMDTGRDAMPWSELFTIGRQK